MLDYEKSIYEKGYQLIVGTDEAGRGPLVGPVVCAAVIFDKNYQNEDINDSKKLTDKKRRILFEQIKKDALAYAIVSITPEEIDRINIYEASRLGMSKAIRQLKIEPDYILTDCMPLFDFKQPLEALVKGDAKALCIAAASILAKVTRDDYLVELDMKYPEYGFRNNKGYPTKSHLEAIKKYGIVPKIYRLSYRPVKEVLNEQIKLF